MTSQRKLDMVGTRSDTRKRAKRMPDISFETTGPIFTSQDQQLKMGSKDEGMIK